MVNTGKPSTGCYLCRARRIKCDEAKPHCMRCQKSKRACPGYRDSFELNLRDETRATKKKAARVPIPPLSNYIYDVGQLGQQGPVINDWSMTTYAEPHRDMERSSPVWSSPSDSSPAYSPTSSTSSYIRSPYITSPSMCSHIPLPLPKSLGTPVDQQVMCFFLSHFVLVPEEGTPRGFFNFLLPLLQKEIPGSPMSVAFSAVALAAFGGRPSSRKMLPRADTLYVKALNQINVVLQDPKLASKDSTLAAVLLLAFYEARAILSEEHFWEASLTSSQTLTSTQLTIKGWVSHLEGAVALVKSRGKKQMETQVGRDMFLAIKSQMTLASIANSRRVNFGSEWWTTLEPPDDVIRVVNELNLRVADLRADCDTAISMVPRTPANIEIVTRLCREAEALEQEFSEWFESLPPNWRPSPVSWVDAIPEGKLSTSVCHPGRVDVFGELYLASRYIIALSSRLFVSATILRCAAWLCSPLDYRITPEYTVAARSCGQIIEDIVASVPYFFGWKPDIDIGPSKSHFVCGDDHFHTAKGLSGFFSLWPIFSAATSDFCTDTQRVWLRGRMVFIAESLGISQAALLLQAEQLRYPSMFIYRDAMNLPPSNCKVPQAPQSLPSSPASFPASPESCHSTVGVDPNCVEESDWYLKLSEARMVQARHSINSSPAPSHKFAEFIAV